MTLPTSVLEELRRAVGREHVIDSTNDLRIFERDASIEGAMPDAVVLPATTSEVSAVIKVAAKNRIPVVPRGAGTGLSGGAVTIRGGIALQVTRMRKILEIDPVTQTALVEPGVVNQELSLAAASQKLFYAPDPSSQKACTIGGNAAENSGGPHCLYYGVTTNHVIGMEVVLADGSVHWVSGDAPDRVGLDLCGVLVGSEGTLCAITTIKVRLLRVPPSVATLLAAFPSIEAASQAVSAVIGHGIVPAALEMMDKVTVGAVEAHYHAGYPTDAGAVLLVEVDGIAESTLELMNAIRHVLAENHGYAMREAQTPAERDLLWAGRKGAIGALGRIKPNYYLHDGVVPRSRLRQTSRAAGARSNGGRRRPEGGGREAADSRGPPTPPARGGRGRHCRLPRRRRPGCRDGRPAGARWHRAAHDRARPRARALAGRHGRKRRSGHHPRSAAGAAEEERPVPPARSVQLPRPHRRRAARLGLDRSTAAALRHRSRLPHRHPGGAA